MRAASSPFFAVSTTHDSIRPSASAQFCRTSPFSSATKIRVVFFAVSCPIVPVPFANVLVSVSAIVIAISIPTALSLSPVPLFCD